MLAATVGCAVRMTSTVVGAISHLAGELLKKSAGVDIIHFPYKGAGDAISNLLGGQVQLMFSSAASVVPLLKVGKLKGFAVTGAKRTSSSASSRPNRISSPK